MMKKIFALVFLLVLGKMSFSQGYPLVQNLGSDSTIVISKGALQSRLINVTFTDTTQASNQRIKFYPGAQIATTSGGINLWVRNATATAWIPVAVGSGNNIYTIDGTLTGNRTLSGGGNSLTFTGLSQFLLTVGNQTFTVRNDSASLTRKLSYANNRGSTFTLYSLVDKNYVDSAITSSPAGTVTSIATNNGSGITGGPITSTGTLAIDTTNVIATKASLAGGLAGKLNIVDTTNMLKNYVNNVGYGMGKTNQIVYVDSASLSTYYLRRKDSLTATNSLGYVTRKILADTAAAIRASDAGGSVTSVATNNGTGITGGTITTSGTLAIDTTLISTRAWRQKGVDSLQANINQKLNISDTASMLNPYLRKVDTASLSNRINQKLNISDTAAMLSPYLRSNTAAATYVPLTRNLTINGTTQNLSADRTFNVGTVTSVALTMPSAFNVAGSPVTSSGTLAVTGAGLASQYIRGDGTLANFPGGGGGGGSSVSYYLNGSVNQGTFGGNTYYQMNKTPVIGAGTNFTIAANGYIAQFITNAGDPALLNIPAGNWNFEMYFSASSAGGNPQFYVELYKYDGTTFTLIASGAASPESITGGTVKDLYLTSLAVPATSLTLTDRLAVRVYILHDGRTITLHTEDQNLCQVITTFTTGITAINSLTAQVQYLTTGTSGTDFNISSLTDTHTFNLPVASATNTGKLSSANWTTFNNKIGPSDTASMLAPYLRKADTTAMLANYVNNVGYGLLKSGQVVRADSSTLANYFLRRKDSLTSTNLLGYVTRKVLSDTAAAIRSADAGGTVTSVATNNGTGITGGTITTSGTLAIDTLLISTRAWRQKGIDSVAALANTKIGGSGTINRVSKFTASGTIGNSSIADSSASVAMTIRSNGNVGIGITAPDSMFAVSQGALFQRGVRMSGLPSAPGTKALRIDANGTISIADTTTGGGGGSIGGSGTTNYVPKFTASTTLGNSLIFDTGTGIAIGNGQSSATPQLGLIEGTDGSGTNIAGAEFRLQGGQSTGSAAGGPITFYTSAAGTAGTGVNAATERMRLDASGNLGIGTTSPITKLHASISYTAPTGGIDANVQILTSNTSTGSSSGINMLSSNSGVSFLHFGDTDDANIGEIAYTHVNDNMLFVTAANIRMRLDNLGNLGINTNTIGSRLQVNGNAAIGYSASTAAPTNGLVVAGQVGIGTSSVTAGYNLNVSGLGRMAGANVLMNYGELDANNNYIQSINLAGNAARGLVFYGTAEFMRINSSGTVFIGNGETVASPSTGIISATGGTGTNIAGAEFRIRGGASTGSAAGGPITFYTSAAGTAGTGVNAATERMRIDGAGRTTITTSGNIRSLNLYETNGRFCIYPYFNSINGAILQSLNLAENVYQPMTFEASNHYFTNTNGVGISTQTVGSRLQVNGNAAIGYSASTAAPTNGLAVSGNVGIGISNPSANLALSGTGNIGIRIKAGSATNNVAYIDLGNTDSGNPLGAIAHNNTSGDLYFSTGGNTRRMGISNTGLVGINTPTPTGRLHVDPDDNEIGLNVSTSSLTGSNAQSLVDLAQTWNTTGNPTAIKLNITNTASGASAYLMDLQVGSATQFRVTKAGAIRTAAPTTGTANDWKLGSVVGGTTVLDTTQWLEVEVGGTLYRVALVTLPEPEPGATPASTPEDRKISEPVKTSSQRIQELENEIQELRKMVNFLMPTSKNKK